MIPDSYGEAGMYFVGCGVYCGCDLTELETYKISITKDDFINNNYGIMFQYYPHATYSECNVSLRFPTIFEQLSIEKYKQILVEYEDKNILIPANDDSNYYISTNNISYHPLYKHCEKWLDGYGSGLTPPETDWITIYFLKPSEEYIYFKLSFSSIARSDNLKLYTTDSLDNIYSEDLSDTSKFEFLGDMEILPDDLNVWAFNPISVYT